MKRALIMTLTLVSITFGTTDIQAAKQDSKPCPHCGRHHATAHKTAKSSNVFSRLWELEKRKNAWLMRTFMGR